PQTSDPVAPVLEHDDRSDPHETAASSFPTREDAPLGGEFHTSPPRSSHAPPAGQPSGGEEDTITLTALSSVVLTLGQKVHSLEAELHDHKKLFKNVDGDTQDVDLDALRALAHAAVAAGSDIPSGSTLQIPAACPSVPTAGSPGTSGVPPATSAIPPGASDAPTGASTGLPGTSVVPADASAVPTGSPNVPADSPNVPAGVTSKGKSPMVEEDIPIKAWTFRQMEEDRLGEEAAKRLHDEEMAQIERERVEAQRKRQQEVLDSAMYYNESDWLNIRAQVKGNASLSKTLLGDDVSEDNFPARMAALIKKKRQALAEQLVPISPIVSSPPSSRTRHKSLGRKHIHKPQSSLPRLDLHDDAQTFLKVVVTEDSGDEVWSAVVGWEVLPTPLGVIKALYRIDETVFGEVLSMFKDVSYPLSVALMEKILRHKLEIDSDFVGNDLTTADQLIQFIKNQLVAAQASSV
nr:JmjC domain-containing protein [Tanacetum cinerariifolium]